MILAAISYCGVCGVVLADGKMDFRRYFEVLEEWLLPNTSELLVKVWTFQQDGAPVHRS